MNTLDDPVFIKVRDVVTKTFRVAAGEITPATALGVLSGWDSFGHISLMMEIENAFAIQFPTDKINQPTTVGEICQLVNQVKTNK